MFSTIESTLDWLYTQKKLQRREDLSRISNCIRLLKIQTNYPIIHIAGTNGKGSTASFLKNMLMLKNQHVGFFVSPFVVCFNERIQVNERYISDSEIMHYANILYTFSKEYEKNYHDTIPFFELTFLMSLLYFQDRKIDIAIIECGLGGKLDATNVLDSTISVITNIGYDHMSVLGNTLEEIADHKLGITRKHHPCFTCVSDELKAYFDDYAAQKDITMFYVDQAVSDIHMTDRTYFQYQNESYQTALLGKYQAYNASLAIAVMKYLDKKYPKDLIDAALMLTKWPGRMEKISNHPTILLDGAHNIPGITALVESLQLLCPNQKIKVVFTALADKAYPQMLQLLDETASFYYFTSLQDKRATDAHAFSTFTKRPYEENQNPLILIDKAIRELEEDEVLVITGSLHFISTIRSYLLNKERNRKNDILIY